MMAITDELRKDRCRARNDRQTALLKPWAGSVGASACAKVLVNDADVATLIRDRRTLAYRRPRNHV